MNETIRRKKLIEVALPLELINPEAVRQKKKAPKGYPTALHKWWAQRPIATCRAVVFSQLVDDPSAWPDEFPTEEDQKRERERLHRIIEAIVPWNVSKNEEILNLARWEIARSISRARSEKPPQKSNIKEVINYLQEHAPPVYDPFCGSGSIPLEAQRLGLKAVGSDLNPVAVLLSKSLIEICARFDGRPAINSERDRHRSWHNAAGLADDVKYYGDWIRTQAQELLGSAYPSVRYDGVDVPVVAWLWVRTVTSPDPICKGAKVPLISSQILSSRRDQKVWVDVVRDEDAKDGWKFEIKSGSLDKDAEKRLKAGTVARSGGGTCALTNSPMPFSYIRDQGKSQGLGVRLMAMVVDTPDGRKYLSPSVEQEEAATIEFSPADEFEAELPENPRDFKTPNYGLTRWRDQFTSRQLFSLSAISDLVKEVRERILSDALESGMEHGERLCNGGSGAEAYADAVSTFLAFVVDRMAAYGSTQSTWLPKDNAIRSAFNRQAMPMTWDFAEANIFAKSSGAFNTCLGVISACVEEANAPTEGSIFMINAANGTPGERPKRAVISTDPPYYDNVGYSELSDFFYVWLRRSLRDIWPELFRRLLSPKNEELIASSYRHGGQEKAEDFFLSGMRKALSNIIDCAHDDYPTAIYYAFKQSEAAEEGLTSPGWATFLQAVSDAGFVIDGTWPVRSEGEVRMNSNSANALASSIVLVCTKRSKFAEVATRREFLSRLKREMPEALKKIKEAGVGPVDMAQSALGPGMGIFTSYGKVLEPDDSHMSVRTAIALINDVREEILGEEDAHYDSETRFCIDWFQAFGMESHTSGDAINMANAYNLGLIDLEQAGVFHAQGGKARLVKRADMPSDWRPSTDKTLTHWECTQHLIRVLESEEGSTADAAGLIAEMSPEDAEAARALAYRLYDICEKKGWAQEAKAYNLLAEEFPHLEQAALDVELKIGPAQGSLDLKEVRS